MLQINENDDKNSWIWTTNSFHILHILRISKECSLEISLVKLLQKLEEHYSRCMTLDGNYIESNYTQKISFSLKRHKLLLVAFIFSNVVVDLTHRLTLDYYYGNPTLFYSTFTVDISGKPIKIISLKANRLWKT